ncbi:hypothetical protein DFS34DRAFT_19116 [Phlyctochytrium arcticum]|nr:hypothetical protein DFS34DRAFT_19116 [Phlyctochytrium arcticum]
MRVYSFTSSQRRHSLTILQHFSTSSPYRGLPPLIHRVHRLDAMIPHFPAAKTRRLMPSRNPPARRPRDRQPQGKVSLVFFLRSRDIVRFQRRPLPLHIRPSPAAAARHNIFLTEITRTRLCFPVTRTSRALIPSRPVPLLALFPSPGPLRHASRPCVATCQSHPRRATAASAHGRTAVRTAVSTPGARVKLARSSESGGYGMCKKEGAGQL